MRFVFALLGLLSAAPALAQLATPKFRTPAYGDSSTNAATTEWVLGRAPPVVNVTPKFCPVSQLTGTTSNNACVQEAVNYACAPENGVAGQVVGQVVFSRGDYLLSNINIPMACAGLKISGQGRATRIFSNNTCAGPAVFNFYGDATQNYVYGGGVSDLQFFNNTLTGGTFTGSTSCLYPLVSAKFGRDMRFERISALSPYILIKLIGGLNLTVDDVAFDQALPASTGVFEFMGYGAQADATGQLTRQDVVRLSKVNGYSAVPGTGIQYARGVWWHGFSATLQVNNVAFTTISTALKIDCTNPGIAGPLQAANIGACPGFGVFNDFETEAAGANAIDITDAQSMQFNSLYASCYPRTSTSTPHTSGCGNAFKVANTTFTTTGGVAINGGYVHGAQASGISYEGFQLTVQGGVKIWGNDAANVGGAGILIDYNGANTNGSHTITGNLFCQGPAANSTGAETPIRILASNNWIVVANNNFRACAAGYQGSVGAKGIGTPNIDP